MQLLVTFLSVTDVYDVGIYLAEVHANVLSGKFGIALLLMDTDADV
jgi:hypothetical protein